MATAGEVREKLIAARVTTRNRSHDRLMRAVRTDENMTENDIALQAYDDGWNDGYAAGYQQALSAVQGALADTIRAQRTGIMSKMD